MKFFARLLILCTVEAALPSPADAADPRDPDWPCMQAKVPEMSVASMWDGPSIADVGNSWEDDPKINDLVVRPLRMSSQAVPPRSKTRPKRSLPACSRP